MTMADETTDRMLGKAGLPNARRILGDSLGKLAECQRELLACQEGERAAKEALEAALVAAEWELDGRFVAEGNKTYLLCEFCKGDPIGPDGQWCPKCPRGSAGRKAMTADERAKWKATEARKLPEVSAMAAALRRAEHETAVARNALTLAETTLKVRRADLDAAIAHLGALVTALPTLTKGAMK